MKLISFYSDKDLPIFHRIIGVMAKLREEGVFCGKVDRLALSCPTFLINENDNDIGFLYFAEENGGRILSVDMGIIKEYRNQGIGFNLLHNVIECLSTKTDAYIIAEVKPDNYASLALVQKLGGILVAADHYLLQPQRLYELKEELDAGRIKFEQEDVRLRVWPN